MDHLDNHTYSGMIPGTVRPHVYYTGSGWNVIAGLIPRPSPGFRRLQWGVPGGYIYIYTANLRIVHSA